MKFKRFSHHHNRRMRCKQFARLGLPSLESFLPGPETASATP
jgi:hypothetical protein